VWKLLGRFIRARELQYAQRDNNRYVRPFDWGLSYILEHVNGEDPRDVLNRYAYDIVQRSEEFYALQPPSAYKLTGNHLMWPSAVHTPSPVNNTVHARYFAASNSKGRAVIVLPQWNAQPDSHVDLCLLLNKLGISALRITLPYHEERRPPELERAEHLVGANIGRTIQSIRQAVLDTRAGFHWLREIKGYDRIGIMGTSIGSCTAFLAYSHEKRFKMGVFNHVSGYFADVVWRGVSTQHVRRGFGDAITLDELRNYWLPISPISYIERLKHINPRPMRFIAARYDLTFPPDLSRAVINEVKQHGLPVSVSWLPCGHYTSGEKPWVYLDAWKIVSYLKRHL
jgi:hypothetical protein